MNLSNFAGYKEGADLSKISMGYLAYPSKNVLVTKNKVITRGGLVNDGTAVTVDEPVHSEFVWKDSAGGVRALRVHGQTVQVKHGDIWLTIFTSLTASTPRVFFATWIDSNTTVIKKRLFFCDGSTTLYQWNGFIGTVASFTPNTVTFVADKANLGLMGADAGNVTTQNVRLYQLTGGVVTATDTTRAYTTDITGGLTMPLNGAPSFTPAAGDLVAAAVTSVPNAVSSTFNIDVVYGYQNHLIAAQYDSVEVFFSHVSTYVLATGLNFVQPAAASRTALTAIYLHLEGGFQGMISRKNVLWVSDTDDWYKCTKTVEKNAYDLWMDVEKFETGDNKGCLPMATAKHKGDIIYLARDLTLQRITTIDVIGKDDILLLSDEVEGLFRRLDPTDVRLYYFGRGIFIIFPTESTLVILDTAEQTWFFQPPQTMPLKCLSSIGGVLYGHHNGNNQSFKMFSGRDDLGAPLAEAKLALGFMHNTTAKSDDHFVYKRHDLFGLDIRVTDSTHVLVERFMEENGAKAITTMEFDGGDIKNFQSDDDASWATNPYATRAWGGADMDVTDLKRAYVFDKERNDGHFEFRPIITLSGTGIEFHLLGFYANEEISKRSIGSDLFVPRND